MLANIFQLLGGITLFLIGLKFVSAFSELIGKGLKKWLIKISRSNFLSMLLGAGVTSLTQSSVAVNMLVISLVEKQILPLISAYAIIIGTNIGTTITAQLVSASISFEINITAIGGLVGFIGLILTNLKGDKIKTLGKVLIGFGFIFMGIKIMTLSMQSFYDKEWFLNLFLVKCPPISLLNGFFITSLCQSSTVVTTFLCILAQSEIISLQNAIYMILGANIGSCVLVIFASKDYNITAKRAGVFNLVFNILGAMLFFVIMLVLGNQICSLIIQFSTTTAQAVANFHTLFNIITALLALPFLKQINKFILFLSRQKVNKPDAKKFKKCS